MSVQIKLVYGGEPPFGVWGRLYRWDAVRQAFRDLVIPDGEKISTWMRIEGLPDEHWAKRAQAAIGNDVRSLKDHDRNWDYVTGIENMPNGTFRVWVAKILKTRINVVMDGMEIPSPAAVMQ
jgi:hypothetical protein